MSFPDLDWGKVPGDIFNQLVKGIQKEFFSGHPTPGTPNAITGVFKLLSSILGGGLGGFGDIVNGVLGGLNPLAANALPAPEAKTVALANSPAGTAGDNATTTYATPASAPIAEPTGGSQAAA
jgi:hypothetical protein